MNTWLVTVERSMVTQFKIPADTRAEAERLALDEASIMFTDEFDNEGERVPNSQLLAAAGEGTT
jgi:hypothetical protein